METGSRTYVLTVEPVQVQGWGRSSVEHGTEAAQPSARSDGPRRAPGSRPLLVLAAVAGISVTALCLHAAGAAPKSGGGPLHGSWLLVLLAALIGGWYATVKYRVRQDERPLGTPREARLIALTTLLLVLTTLGTCVAVIGLGMSGGAHDIPTFPMEDPVAQATATRPGPAPVVVHDTPKGTPGHPFPLAEILFSLVIAAGAVTLVVLVVLILRRLTLRGRPAAETASELEPRVDEAALSEAVGAGRLALQGEDVRAAVIACYAAMEESLAAGGVGRKVADSPADLLDRATAAGLLAGLAPRRLARLFREARYSSHPMNHDQLQRARRALDDISRLLAERAAAAEAAAAAPAGAGAAEAEAVPAEADQLEAALPKAAQPESQPKVARPEAAATVVAQPEVARSEAAPAAAAQPGAAPAGAAQSGVETARAAEPGAAEGVEA